MSTPLAVSSVLNILDLRNQSAPTSGTPSMEVLGYHTPGDGGGGYFYWDPTSTATDDGGSTITPTSAPASGRWRQFFPDGIVSVKQFGAYGDGAHDDTTAIQSTIDFVGNLTSYNSSGGVVYFPASSYRVTAGFTIAYNNVMIRGAGRASMILCVPATGSIPTLFWWRVAGARGEGGGICDLTIYGNTKLDWVNLIDTWRFWSAEHVQVLDELQGFCDIQPIESNQFCENLFISHCDRRSSSGTPIKTTQFFVRLRPSPDGSRSVTDSLIQQCLCIGLVDTGIHLDCTQRIRVEQFAAGNNEDTLTFNQAVLITNTTTANKLDSSGNVLDGIYCECHGADGSATGVVVDAVGGFTRWNIVRAVLCEAHYQLTFLHLKNSSTTPGANSNTTYEDHRSYVYAAGSSPPPYGTVIIDPNVVDAQIYLPGSTDQIKLVADSGSRTRINRQSADAYGVGNGPLNNKTDVGDIILNSSDQTVWVKTKDGVQHRIDTPTGVGVATISGGGTTLDWSLYTKWIVTLTSSPIALSFATVVVGTTIYLRIVQDATGGRAVTWPSGSKFPNGTAPTLSTAANAVDTFQIVCPAVGVFEVYTLGLNIH